MRARSPTAAGRVLDDPRPEDKASQQDRQLREICKTSIPGSNPGGASIFPRAYIRSFRAQGIQAGAPQMDSTGLQIAFQPSDVTT
jgi:hypothetical protein